MERYVPLVGELSSESESDEDVGAELEPRRREAARGDELARPDPWPPSASSDVVMVDRQALEAVATNMPETVNLNNAHNNIVGTAFISVRQEYYEGEAVKGKLLCFDLKWTKASNKLRCSVAICLCWTLIFASCLAVYIFIFVIPQQQTRLDIGLNESWFRRREEWQAMPAQNIAYLHLPVQYVIIGHSATPYCENLHDCSIRMIDLQNSHLQRRYDDIIPNYVVAGKGYIFEARGANVLGSMIQLLDRNSISIMFLGNYKDVDETDPEQLEHLAVLLDALLTKGVLCKDYVIYGFCQVETHVSNPEVSLLNYLWTLIKNTTKLERILLGIILLLLIFSISLGVFVYLKTTGDSDDDIAPHPWNITRTLWLAKPFNGTSLTEYYGPLRLVVIQHSVTRECHKFVNCASELRSLQLTFILDENRDLPYNFIIANDGRIYEGRGWGKQPDHSLRYNECSLSIGFIGDYREYKTGFASVTNAQIERLKMLLEIGVAEGQLHPEYVLQGAKDLWASESPGSNLYNAIRLFEHYDDEHRYYTKTCDEIYSPKVDKAPHEWNITREMWQAKPYNVTEPTKPYEPLRMVVIQPSTSEREGECHSFAVCVVKLRNMQDMYLASKNDIPYNFLVGNDGRLYEGRGFGKQGNHSVQFDPCALNIAFIGDYAIKKSNTTVTEAQINRTQMLLKAGVKQGYLHKKYVVVDARDIMAWDTKSSNLYNVIKKWKQYDNKKKYSKMTCDQIHSLSLTSDTATVPAVDVTTNKAADQAVALTTDPVTVPAVAVTTDTVTVPTVAVSTDTATVPAAAVTTDPADIPAVTVSTDTVNI